MEAIYQNTAHVLKALSDPKRLKIVDMLSCGEICACRILEYFNVTQPTLSHDMKVLTDAGVVRSRREGKNIYYRLETDNLKNLLDSLQTVFNTKDHCICENTGCNYTEQTTDQKGEAK